jgi:hypothetical protein
LPVSIYFDLSIGKTFSSNAAQCGQLIERVFDDGHRGFCRPERHVRQVPAKPTRTMMSRSY